MHKDIPQLYGGDPEEDEQEEESNGSNVSHW